MISKGVDVISIPWLSQCLYVAGSNPAEVRNNIPPSHCYAVKEIVLLPPQEGPSLAIFKTRQMLPIRTWVRIKSGLYKGDIRYIEHLDIAEAVVVVAPRKHPYDLPEQSGEKDIFCSELATLAGLPLVPISSAVGVDVGFTCGGQDFISGLLHLSLPVGSLTPVELPHPDDLAFHMITNFERSFVEETIHLFSAQFWREHDTVEVQGGDLHGARGSLVDIEWNKRSASLILHTLEVQEPGNNIIHCSIQELHRVFSSGDAVKVIAGPYRGYAGHVITSYDSKVILQCDGQSLNVSYPYFLFIQC